MEIDTTYVLCLTPRCVFCFEFENSRPAGTPGRPIEVPIPALRILALDLPYAWPCSCILGASRQCRRSPWGKVRLKISRLPEEKTYFRSSFHLPKNISKSNNRSPLR